MNDEPEWVDDEAESAQLAAGPRNPDAFRRPPIRVKPKRFWFPGERRAWARAEQSARELLELANQERRMTREPAVEVLARAMCGLGGWGAWDRFSEMQRDQIRSEAQQCIEALQSAGWVIIAQATQEEFDAAQRELAKGYERLADYDREDR